MSFRGGLLELIGFGDRLGPIRSGLLEQGNLLIKHLIRGITTVDRHIGSKKITSTG